MTRYNYLIMAAGLACVSNPLLASDLTFQGVFVAGTPAIADEVNANNLAIEIAVDDNNARITALEEAGRVAVHANGFQVTDSGCTANNVSYLSLSTGTNCNASANISLPDHSTITDLTCTVFDNNFSTGADIEAKLYRIHAEVGISELVFNTPAAINSSSVQQLIDDSTTKGGIDNSRYFYRLDAFFGVANGSTTVRLYGCSVGYTR